MRFTAAQQPIPNSVGRRKAIIVHFMLPLSFFTVISVVEQGQCISENSITHTAVMEVHPCDVSNSESAFRSVISVSVPLIV